MDKYDGQSDATGSEREAIWTLAYEVLYIHSLTEGWGRFGQHAFWRSPFLLSTGQMICSSVRRVNDDHHSSALAWPGLAWTGCPFSPSLLLLPQSDQWTPIQKIPPSCCLFTCDFFFTGTGLSFYLSSFLFVFTSWIIKRNMTEMNPLWHHIIHIIPAEKLTESVRSYRRIQWYRNWWTCLSRRVIKSLKTKQNPLLYFM